MNYTTIAKVEAYSLKDIAADFEADVTVWIEAMSRYADTYCNRTLVLSDESDPSQTRYYDGNGKDLLYIDDLQTLTSVSLGDIYGANFTALSSSDYVKYPAVAPHRALVLKSGVFTKGIQNVKVIGTFGYFATIPEDLAFAVSVLVTGIINGQEPGAQDVQSERIGNYSVTYSDGRQKRDFERAMAILDGYKKHLL